MVNVWRKLGDVHFKPLLNIIQNLGIRFIRDKCYGQSFCSKSSSPSNSMEIGVRIFWHVIVEDDVDSLDVHASSEEVCCHKDARLEILELLVPFQPLK